MPETDDPGAIEDHTRESAAPRDESRVTTDLDFVTVVPDRPSSRLHYVFVGRDGLRAGWGVLLFLTLFLVFASCSGLLLQKVAGKIHGRPRTAAAQSQSGQPVALAAGMSPMSVFAGEGVAFLSVALATWVMAKIERRKIPVYGFNRQRRLRNFCAGLVCGVALLSLLIVLLRAAGLLVFDRRLLFGSSILGYGLIWLAAFLLVGMVEECVNRAYLQFTLTRGLSAIYRRLFGEAKANALGFWTAALLLSFAFGLGHRSNPGESPLGLLSAGLAGCLFCFSLWRTGSLWWAIGFHATWDWAQSFLYGVADSGLMVKGHLFATHPVGRPILSGGLTGPEGSILLLPVIMVGAVAILFSLPRTHFGYIPASASQAPLN